MRGAKLHELKHLQGKPHLQTVEHEASQVGGDGRGVLTPFGDGAKQCLGLLAKLVASLVTGDQNLPKSTIRCYLACHRDRVLGCLRGPLQTAIVVCKTITRRFESGPHLRHLAAIDPAPVTLA